MLPVNAIFYNRIAVNFYYSLTKRNIFGALSSSHPKNSYSSDLLGRQKRFLASKSTSTTPECHLSSDYFNEFPNYCQMITDAKSRARRSILIDHVGAQTIDLNSNLKESIEQVYHIENGETGAKLTLIEFKTERDADDVAALAQHQDGSLAVNLKMFRYFNPSASNTKTDNNDRLILPKDLPNITHKIKSSNRGEYRVKTDSYSSLVSSCKMSSIELKLRFITLVNYETMLCSGLFSNYELMPFGSSVIDIGSDSGDLDILFTKKIRHEDEINRALEGKKKLMNVSQMPNKLNNNLRHMDKILYSVENDDGTRLVMQHFDLALRELSPLSTSNSILTLPFAKVPIIRFTSKMTNIDCDLSFDLGINKVANGLLRTNYSSIVTAHILYSLCRKNNLVVTVVTYLRIFAKLTAILSKSQGWGFSNFQFLSLVLFYLQRVSFSPVDSSKMYIPTNYKNSVGLRQRMNLEHLVPPFIDLLRPESGDADTQAKPPTDFDGSIVESLAPKLITGFFRFYSGFDFNSHSINLLQSKIHPKLDNSLLFVQNPLDDTRNICHNISRRALERLVKQVNWADKLKISPLETISQLISSHGTFNGSSKGFTLVDGQKITSNRILVDKKETIMDDIARTVLSER